MAHRPPDQPRRRRPGGHAPFDHDAKGVPHRRPADLVGLLLAGSVHPALKLAGLEKRPPYSLRHTFAYWSLRAGVPIATVAREKGHAERLSRRSASTADGAPRWAKVPPNSGNLGLPEPMRNQNSRNPSRRAKVECPPRALEHDTKQRQARSSTCGAPVKVVWGWDLHVRLAVHHDGAPGADTDGDDRCDVHGSPVRSCASVGVEAPDPRSVRGPRLRVPVDGRAPQRNEAIAVSGATSGTLRMPGRERQLTRTRGVAPSYRRSPVCGRRHRGNGPATVELPDRQA